MSKKQVFVAKGSSPWYHSTWIDMIEPSHVINTDKSVSGQATVTCEGLNYMGSMFCNCYNLTALDLSNFDTSSVTDMSALFFYCDNLTALDLSSFNTSNVTNMNDMFANCDNLTTLDVSGFDTSNVKDMNSMFFYCSNLTELDLSNFDTSNVTDMDSMFYNCCSLTTIKGIIDMKSCEDCGNMFEKCPRLRDVKIKNPPDNFESMSGLSKSQYTVVS